MKCFFLCGLGFMFQELQSERREILVTLRNKIRNQSGTLKSSLNAESNQMVLFDASPLISLTKTLS